MEYEILSDGKLKLKADAKERAELQRQKDEREMEGGTFGTSDDEFEALEALVANSELSWVEPADTGDLTSAPMLGILGEQGVRDVTVFVPNFGLVDTGNDGHNLLAQPIIARWAYMNYQVRTFLDDMIDKGYSIWDGGYAHATDLKEEANERRLDRENVEIVAQMRDTYPNADDWNVIDDTVQILDAQDKIIATRDIKYLDSLYD